jgi:hypothetical protein
MEERARFLQQLRTEVPGITPGELHDCAAYFWQDEPFIALTSHHQLAYRISEAADALPLPHHLEHWNPEGKALTRWRVLVHEEPKDWMLTALRALELVQGELDGISVPPDGGGEV